MKHLQYLSLTALLFLGTSKIYALDKDTREQDKRQITTNPQNVAQYLVRYFKINPTVFDKKGDAEGTLHLNNIRDARNYTMRLGLMKETAGKNVENIDTILSHADNPRKNNPFKTAQRASLWASVQYATISFMGLFAGGSVIYFGSKTEDSRLVTGGAMLTGLSLLPTWAAYKKGREATKTGQITALTAKKEPLSEIHRLISRSLDAVTERKQDLEKTQAGKGSKTNTIRNLPSTFSTPITVEDYLSDDEDDNKLPIITKQNKQSSGW